MGALEGGARFILVLINILLSLVGLALLIIGCVAKWGENLTDQYLSEVYKTFQNAVNAINSNVDVSNFNIADVLNDVFIALIVLGGFFFLFGIFGCIGATCRVKVALIVYSGVLIFIILAELVCVVLLFTIREKIDGWLKDPMKKQLKEKYSGLNGTDIVTLTWNLLMTNLHCCGVDSSMDFENATSITTLPDACCSNKPSTCFLQTANNSRGCYAAAEDWLNGHLDIVIGSLSGVGGLEVILLFFSCLTFCASRRSKKTEDNQHFVNEFEKEPPRMNRGQVHNDPSNVNYGYAFENLSPHRNRVEEYDKLGVRNQTHMYGSPSRMNQGPMYDSPSRMNQGPMYDSPSRMNQGYVNEGPARKNQSYAYEGPARIKNPYGY